MAGTNSVLLIDDDAESGEILQLLLARKGFDVDLATEAGAGLRTFDRKRHRYVISDLNMGGVSGFDVAEALAKHRYRPVLVALSGDMGPDVSGRVKRAGFDHHLVKPIDLQALETLLNTFSTRALGPEY